MCGFVGGILDRPVTEDDLRAFVRAADTLAHRGPDDRGVAVIAERNAILAFRRLAIIDLANGHQPMSTPDGDHLVFNGEIYDYREHRARLSEAGVAFQTSSDTEVLLQLLAREGPDGLREVRGMFALAHLDPRRRHLLLARDRLGIKPLYFTERPSGFFFASEPKAILALPWFVPELDEGRLAAYFGHRCVPSPQTLFRDLERLPAGHVLIRSFDRPDAMVVRPVWQLPAAPSPDAPSIGLAEAVDRVEESLLTAVRRRLVADVPVGAFLSGGLDSALIVAAMARLGHPEIRTFTASFPGSRDDESAFAARIARRFGLVHVPVPLQAEQFLAELPRWVELNDDLVADPSALPLLRVSGAARAAGCLVLLSGEGADELFAGYGVQHKQFLLHAASRVGEERSRAWLIRLLAESGLVGAQDLPRLRAYFVRRSAYLGAASLGDEPELTSVLDPALVGPYRAPRASGDSLAAICRFDLGPRLADDLLLRTDRATMGASIECRVPFLDHEFVETVVGLPDRWRAVPGMSKIALRLLGRRWGLPWRTLLHRKIGFQLPLGEWFRGALHPRWRAILGERAIPGLNYQGIAGMYDRHLRRRGDHAELLWRVFALECWFRRWVRLEREPAVIFAAQADVRVGVAA